MDFLNLDQVSLTKFALIGLVLFLGLIFLYFLKYIGLIGKVKVTVGKPAISNVWIAYKNHTGPYKNCGPHFIELISLCPKLECVGIYYDDPNVVPEDQHRYVAGVILCNGDEEPRESLVSRLRLHDFRIHQLPLIDFAVKATFPFVFDICPLIAVWRVYPAIAAYVKQHHLTAHPFLEYYAVDGVIHYIGPLSEHRGFYVPEVEYIVPDLPASK